MRSLSTKILIWSIAKVSMLALGLTSLGTVSAKNKKVNICHYQEETNSWKLISVGQSAAGAHFEHHDDAFPGETTSQTGTVLDADCVEEAVTCPCDFTLNAWSQLGIESDTTCFVNGTIAAPEDSFMGTQNSIGTYITGFFTRGDFYCGILINGEDGPRYHQTQAAEAAACRDAIIEVANALDPSVICSFP